MDGTADEIMKKKVEDTEGAVNFYFNLRLIMKFYVWKHVSSSSGLIVIGAACCISDLKVSTLTFVFPSIFMPIFHKASNVSSGN